MLRFCGRSGEGWGRSTGMLARVASTSFMSLRLAPAAASPIGTPRPSVKSERLAPLLPRSVGLGPVLFPPERGFRHRPVHRLPLPVDPDLQVVLDQARPPELAEHPG